jgi:peptidoglycan/LPS O-acetylase OafA/YrhL
MLTKRNQLILVFTLLSSCIIFYGEGHSLFPVFIMTIPGIILFIVPSHDGPTDFLAFIMALFFLSGQFGLTISILKQYKEWSQKLAMISIVLIGIPVIVLIFFVGESTNITLITSIPFIVLSALYSMSYYRNLKEGGNFE